MAFPVTPRAGSMAWTVTVPALEVAVTGTLALLLRVIAAATFEATTVGVAAAVLVHHGWRATAVKLPTWTGSKSSALVIAPAEVEIQSPGERPA